jgi:hypothetical protein
VIEAGWKIERQTDRQTEGDRGRRMVGGGEEREREREREIQTGTFIATIYPKAVLQ